MPPSQSSQVRFPDTVKLSGLASFTFCSGMGNTCAAVVMLCPGKATGIWMGAAGKPGAKASAGIVTMAVPAGTVTVWAGTYIIDAGKTKLGDSSRRKYPALAVTCGQ